MRKTTGQGTVAMASLDPSAGNAFTVAQELAAVIETRTPGAVDPVIALGGPDVATVIAGPRDDAVVVTVQRQNRRLVFGVARFTGDGARGCHETVVQRRAVLIACRYVNLAYLTAAVSPSHPDPADGQGRGLPRRSLHLVTPPPA
ncbi:hypothetical protein [Myceligenerans indicum]|uniref:Uncharacterized protein n=1 Tax=Myceligenerans indicum TaxID=2593663 RepID=A0ABS1LRG5_9MICO|nr:hypothetical protein [Myceligenerans indicum]MBL0888815.1 hypothetical protein [Myceligenerans indicum]